MTRRSTRREFLQQSSALAAGCWVGTSSSGWAQEKSANSAIRFACIGVEGQGASDRDDAGRHGDIVAICDIDEEVLEKAALRFPKAKKYFDFRKMFDEMADSIDAVTVSTPDHTHALIAMEAMLAAPRDGTTLLFAPNGGVTLVPQIMKSARFDPFNVMPVLGDEEMKVQLDTAGGVSLITKLMGKGEAAARRELLEETGYAPDQIIHLGTVFPNPAIQSNRQHYILATGCRKVAELNLDHAEDIVVRHVPLRDIPEFIRTGKIKHGIVIGGFYWLSLRRRE